MKILNLYAGIGGNRKLWSLENKDLEITAIEYDENIASIYKDFYPNDEVIVTDAHEYLLNNYMNFDFIWSSPPCQTHSMIRQITKEHNNVPAKYIDFKLYQEIIFLKHNFKGLWIIENVRPYYETLIYPSFVLQRHLFWNNFPVEQKKFKFDSIADSSVKELQTHLGFDISAYKVKNRLQVLRNCVYPNVGKHIFDCMIDYRNYLKNKTFELKFFF
jgi:DNA (cytosine-5)-methyltransferase 1